jgi:UDP-3-O-[3-hydroxymyristoyl] glucosamine N-acyltransferase
VAPLGGLSRAQSFGFTHSMITLTLQELAQLCGAEVDGDGTRSVEGPATLAEASPRQVSFLANPRYKSQLATTRAAGVLVARDCERPRADITLLRCADPSKAFTRIVSAFVQDEPEQAPGVHPSAVVDPSARIAPDARVGPLCVVAAQAEIAAGARLVAQVHVGRAVRIGAHSVLHPGVVLYPRVEIGARCTLHGGTVIGSDGYGYEPTREGWAKIPQAGTVLIEDEVEIGANVTIDRGRFGATRIARGVKIDNLVHIAHNVVVGEGALLVAQVGIAGSARIGARAIVAGQAGVNGHVEIGERARIGGQSGVFGDVPAGADYFGCPARPRMQALRQIAATGRVPERIERL